MMVKRRRTPDPDEVLARIRPKPARRWFAIGVTGLLAAILIYIAAAFTPVDLVWLAFLIALGLLCAYWAWLVWRATSVSLELTPTELREEGGRRLCAIEDVDRVDSGFFAFKPAAGFLVHLRTPMSRVYAPGLWWRAGRRVAVGGVTSRAEGKAVAELINVMLAEREGEGR
jgi:hypothetical protein